MPLNTAVVSARAPRKTDDSRADAEQLSRIILEMQRCFVLRLSKELAPGNVSFPQFFLLAALDEKEVLTMSEIAQKMGHTTAAASGLVARLENLGYVVRSSAREDRRKVLVCITDKGTALVRRIREEMVGNLMKLMSHLTAGRAEGVAADLHKDLQLLSEASESRRRRSITACGKFHGVSNSERLNPEHGKNNRASDSESVAENLLRPSVLQMIRLRGTRIAYHR